MMVKVLSNLQFDFHHKLQLESLSKWVKSLLKIKSTKTLDEC